MNVTGAGACWVHPRYEPGRFFEGYGDGPGGALLTTIDGTASTTEIMIDDKSPQE